MICRFCFYVKRGHTLLILSGILAAGSARFRVPMQDRPITEDLITGKLFCRSKSSNRGTRTRSACTSTPSPAQLQMAPCCL